MKIAICQMEIVWENKELNFQKAEAWISKAKEKGADIIFFPEMSFTGFSMNTSMTGENNNFTVSKIIDLCRKYAIYIGFGWVKKEKESAENHYTVVDSKGNIICDYIKIHPFSYSDEDKYFTSGDELKIVNVKGINIGLQICYDLRFPEIFQLLAEKSDLIIVAANWPKRRREHWKCLLQARAIECQSYVAGINCYGMQEGLEYSGDSCLFTPEGKILGGFLEEEGLIIEEIDADIEKYRSNFPMRKDRKWDLYTEMYVMEMKK